jgi:hypothetical protein
MPPRKSARPEEAEPVSVADQKAAGVDPEDTVTIAEQKAGEALPPGAAGDPEPSAGPLRSVSNESPPLAPNAANGAARAHALLDQALAAADGDDLDKAFAIIERAKAELDRYIPSDARAAGVAEAAHVVATEV